MPATQTRATVHELKNPRPTTQTVVVVDDQTTGRLILAEVVKGIDRAIHLVLYDNPLDAVEYARTMPVDLVLTDYKMPQQDGIETIRQLRTMFTYEQLPIVMTTVVSDREVRHRAFDAGATDFLIRPVDPIECRARCQNLLNLRQQYLINSMHARVMEERVLQVTEELRRREIDTLSRLARAVADRNPTGRARLQRMAGYAALIARGIGLPPDEVEAIELAVMLQATTQESARHHLLRDSPSPLLQLAAAMAVYQHEKFDGSGTPTGLRGRAIPIAARIVALADALDAGSQSGLEHAAAIAQIIALRERHFDPELVDALVRHADEAAALRLELAQSAPAP